ncbi:uncharacterized protein [Pseudorasbora parva]|uniref:uncharacterized protein n=1 Tax=Pseudorasbora parva TaxID=51549 RepID=UPI00351E209E
MSQPHRTLSKMERKAFIILYILFASQTTITDSTSSPSSTAAIITPAKSSSTSPATRSLSPSSSSAHTASALLEFHCSETFTPELHDSSSQAFKDRAKQVKDNLETIYKLKYPSFIAAHVLGFRAGSVITTTELIFNSTEVVPSAVEIEYALLINGTINALNITSASIIVDDSGVTSSAEQLTLAGSSTATPSPLTAAFHKTQSSPKFTTTASQPTVYTLISAGSFSPDSTLSTVKTSTTLTTKSSKSTSSLAASSTISTGVITTGPTKSTTTEHTPSTTTGPTPSTTTGPTTSTTTGPTKSTTTGPTKSTTTEHTPSTTTGPTTLTTTEHTTSTTTGHTTSTTTEHTTSTTTGHTTLTTTEHTPSTTTEHTTSTTTGHTTLTTTEHTPSTTTGHTTLTTTEHTPSTTTGHTTSTSTEHTTLTSTEHTPSTTTGHTTLTTTEHTPSTKTEVPTTTAKLVPEILTDLEFHSSDTFTDALNNSESLEFKNRSKLVKDQLEAVYKPKYVNFLRVIVLGFRPGSIITKTQLVFSFNQSLPSRKEILDTLLTAADTGNVNPLNIISQTVSVNGSTFATATPSTMTTPSRAATTSSGSKIESHLLRATCLIIMANILRYFL